MKPRLLKFPCQNCGAKLSVPSSMAGMSDSCPKCGASITAPALPPEETAAPAPTAIDPPVAPAQVAPPRSTSLLPPPELVQSDGPVVTSRKKILQHDAPLPVVQPALTKPVDYDLFPHVTPVTEAAHSVAEDIPSIQPPPATDRSYEYVPPPATLPALVPMTVPEEVLQESAAPGMGEILAEQSSSSTLLQNQDTRPWLHGPFLSTAGPKKRLPGIFSSRYVIAIISFLLIDLFIFFVFRNQITGFFQEENRAAPIPQEPAVPTVPESAAPHSETGRPKTEAPAPPAPPQENAPKPLAPLPTEKTVPTDTVQFTPVPAEASVPKAVAIPPMRLHPVPAEAQPAFDALRRFLEVPTWSERAGYVMKPEAVRPLMEKYASQNGDGPIVVSSINFTERFNNDKGTYCTFEVGGGFLPHPVMAIVEQPANGPALVDWEAFVEFKDDLLLKFLENRGGPNRKFRVTLQRIHYFDKDVPEQDSKDSFGIRQPNAPYEGHVFIEKKSALGTQLATQLPWGKDLLIIAELTWKTNGKDHWVELQAIPSYGWRY